MGETFVRQLRDPLFTTAGPTTRASPSSSRHSLAPGRPGLLLASLVAIPLGFVIGMSPLLRRAFDPFIQVLKPASPLAWMPLALYTIKDSSISGDLCDLYLLGLAHADQHRLRRGLDQREWLNVASTLEVSPLRKAFQVVTAGGGAPPSLAGMRISMGIAWLVIVAAEMLVGGTGVGYFVWNRWNNLSLTSS